MATYHKHERSCQMKAAKHALRESMFTAQALNRVAPRDDAAKQIIDELETLCQKLCGAEQGLQEGERDVALIQAFIQRIGFQVDGATVTVAQKLIGAPDDEDDDDDEDEDISESLIFSGFDEVSADIDQVSLVF